MAAGKKKKRSGRLRRFLCFVLFVLMIAAAFPRMSSIARLYEQKEALSRQKEVLQQENEELTALRDSMEDPGTIEKLAREKLGMIKPGERLMVEGKDTP